MTLKELLEGKELPIKVKPNKRKADESLHYEIVHVHANIAFCFDDYGLPGFLFLDNSSFSLFEEPKKLVKKYKCLLKFRDTYSNSMDYFSTIEEAKSEYLKCFEVIKLLPNTEIEVEE